LEVNQDGDFNNHKKQMKSLQRWIFS